MFSHEDPAAKILQKIIEDDNRLHDQGEAVKGAIHESS